MATSTPAEVATTDVDVVPRKATKTQAKTRAARIRKVTQSAADNAAEYLKLIVEAYEQRDWEALEYDSWESYQDNEIGLSKLKLSDEVRKAAVLYLRDTADMSLRAIGSSLGVSKDTVHRALKQNNSTVSDETPATSTDTDVVDAEVVADEKTVKGLDNKRHKARKSTPRKPAVPARKPHAVTFTTPESLVDKLTKLWSPDEMEQVFDLIGEYLGYNTAAAKDSDVITWFAEDDTEDKTLDEFIDAEDEQTEEAAIEADSWSKDESVSDLS